MSSALSSLADDNALVLDLFPPEVVRKFEIVSYRNAATILAHNFPIQFSHITKALKAFEINTKMIRLPGGNKGEIAHYVDNLFPDAWKETRITADLHVKLLAARKDEILREYVRLRFLDGHRIDFMNDKVALDLEWNSKDQTYDRDLYAFSTFHTAGAIEVGVLLTRGNSMDLDFFRSLGKVIDANGNEGNDYVYKKFGASTTWIGKLIKRLEAGRNGGCPVLALGITPQCVSDYNSERL